MSKIVQRIQSFLASPAQAQEKISDLLIELRHRGLNFDVRFIEEGGEKYFFAQSVGYPRGYINATGENLAELERQLKDAIFTAFGVPVRYCNPDLIAFTPPLGKNQTVAASQKIYATT